LVLGIDAKAPYRTEKYPLPAGASLVMYTDGVLDAENAAGIRFGKELLRRSLDGRFDSAQEILDHVVGALDGFRLRKDLPDDLTIVAVHLPATAVRRAAPVAAH
jgi:sigma-B regulation protein RsbU (phosphoserine phosphatase)